MQSIAGKISSLMLVVLLCVAAGYAQSTSRVIVKVDVPFEFSIGKKVFPAGSYQIVRIAPHMLALRDSNNNFLTSVVTAPAVAREVRPATLKFGFDGEQHVLSQVWAGNASTGYELSIPKRVTYLAQKQPVEVQASVPGKQ